MGGGKPRRNPKQPGKPAPKAPALPRQAFPPRGVALLALLVAAVAVIPFLPVLRYPFVDWDDFWNFTRNEHIRSFSSENVHWMLTTGHLGVWQPAAWFATAAQYQMFDGASETTFSHGMHAVNVGLHAISAAAVFFLLLQLLRRGMPERTAAAPAAAGWAAAAGALLWAMHPLRVELVAWASAQPYILSLLAGAVTVLLYLHGQRTDRHVWLAAAFFAYAVSLLSKSITVPLVAVLVILDWHPLRRFEAGWLSPSGRQAWLEKVPFALLSAGVLIVAPLVKRGAGSTMSLEMHGVIERFAQACFGLVFYVWRTLLPTDLSPLYELRLPLDYGQPRYIIPALIVLAVVIGLFVFRRRSRTLVAAAATFVVLLLPVLGFVQSGNQEVADRYAYLPAIALSVLVAGGAFQLWAGGGWRRAGGVAALVVTLAVIPALGVASWRQCGVWASTTALWTHVARLQPESSLAQNGYGFVLLEAGRLVEAERHFRRSLEIKPGNDVAYFNLWRCLREQGKTDELVAAYRAGAEALPHLAEPCAYLGQFHFDRKEYRQAEEAFRAALEREPGNAWAGAGLTGSLYGLREFEAAVAAGQHLLLINPAANEARYNVALALRALGRRDEALREVREVLRRDPDYSSARRLRRQLERR
jgi:Flp pilus assembly protein TadD